MKRAGRHHRLSESSSSPAVETGLIGGTEKREIVVVPYREEWPRTFRSHAERIFASLGPSALRIEHIGSTAVPGLAAKPVVDMLVVVEDSAYEGSYLKSMLEIGYQLRVREPDFEEHQMFRTPARDVHVHFLSAGSPEIGRYLGFRDVLRRNAACRERYQAHKQTLAGQDWPDMDAYSVAKTELIEEIIRFSQPGNSLPA